MILKHTAEITSMPMAMQGAEKVTMQVLCGPEDGCPNFVMRKFAVAPGGVTPKHQHDFEHEIYILAGEGVAFGNGKEQAIVKGDTLFVPGNELHQFRNTGSGDLEFICMVPAFVHKMAADCSK